MDVGAGYKSVSECTRICIFMTKIAKLSGKGETFHVYGFGVSPALGSSPNPIATPLMWMTTM